MNKEDKERRFEAELDKDIEKSLEEIFELQLDIMLIKNGIYI